MARRKAIIDEYVQMILDMDYDTSLLGPRAWRKQFIREVVTMFTEERDFAIRLSTLAHLLDRRIDILKDTLVDNFDEGPDYRVRKVRTGKRGRPSEDITLSVRAFKDLALRVQGPKATALRGYFTLVEEAYRENRMVQIEDRRMREPEEITQEKARPMGPRRKWPIGHCVYVLRVEDDSGRLKHKIGRTNNLNRRFPEVLHILTGWVAVVHQRMADEDIFLEACAHTMLGDIRLDEEIEMFEADIHKILKTLDMCERHRAEMEEEVKHF